MEEEKQEETNLIEIKIEELHLKVPRNEKKILEAIKVLQTFLTTIEEDRKAEVEVEEVEKVEKPQILEPKKPEITKIEAIDNKQLVDEDMNIPTEEIIAVNPKKFKICPKCGGKLKREKVKQHDDALTQVVRCKDKKCGFVRKYVISN